MHSHNCYIYNVTYIFIERNTENVIQKIKFCHSSNSNVKDLQANLSEAINNYH